MASLIKTKDFSSNSYRRTNIILNMTDHTNVKYDRPCQYKYDGPCQYDRPCKQEMILRHCKYNIEIKHFFHHLHYLVEF